MEREVKEMKLNAVKCNRCGRIHSIETGCEIKNTIITEQEIKSMVTPGIIKKMVEMAGFEIKFETDELIAFTAKSLEHKWYSINHVFAFSTLVHRATEGIIKTHYDFIYMDDSEIAIGINGNTNIYRFQNYQPESLTNLELALLHCLVEVLKEEK